MMRRFLVFLFLINSLVASAAKIVITQSLNAQSVRYYQPFDNFPNVNIPVNLKPDAMGQILITLNTQAPTIVKLVISETLIWLIVEPNDQISIHKTPKVDNQPLGGVFIDGNNAIGHTYYNKIYNYNPIDKFDGVRGVFEKSDFREISKLTDQLERELKRELSWVDSLEKVKKVTAKYAEYMRVELSSVLGWEIGNLCDSNYGKNKISFQQFNNIKNWLFGYIKPLDKRMYSCGLAPVYYYTYYEAIAKKSQVDSTKAIIPEASHYVLMPTDMAKPMWGNLLWVHKTYAPTQYDYQKLYSKYKSTFGDGDYIKFFDSTNFFIKNESKPSIIDFNQDFFMLLEQKFYKKRVFIDIWATWCAPCKAEFLHYNPSFYEFMKEFKIDMVYLSIDKLEHRTKWEKEIEKLGLKGYHVLAGDALQASIKEIIFDEGAMAIPRYVLVDENGKIISTDFKRLSDPMFKKEIEKAFIK